MKYYLLKYSNCVKVKLMLQESSSQNEINYTNVRKTPRNLYKSTTPNLIETSHVVTWLLFPNR
jgi:hypothetical protein